MKITYISHATLLIEVDGINIVTDPWVKGSVYCNQWHLFPKPLHPEKIIDADIVLYSHGHEDHLHAESLQMIDKKAKLLYPYSWYGGTTEFFKELGFGDVKEVVNEQTVSVAPDIKVTYLSNNLDNVIILEVKGKVLVDINDALPSASQGLIRYFIDKIKSRWKKIDYIFSSYGGAAYFPNTVHFKNKNDLEIAETRELFFVSNFCDIVAALKPTFAIPYAVDFVLLDDHQRWVNTAKFPREDIKDFYEKRTGGNTGVQIIEAYPEDYFLDDQFHKCSPYHSKSTIRELISRIDVDYKKEIEAKRNEKNISPDELDRVLEKIKSHIRAKAYIIPESVRTHIKFALKITNASGNNILNVDFRNGDAKFEIASQPSSDVDLRIELKSQTIEYAIDNEWGGDAIIIGYGAEIFLNHEDAVKLEYENYCVRLLSRYPNTKEYLKKTPYRAMKYLLSDDTKRRNLVNRLFGRHDKVIEYTDPKLGDRDLWLNKGKCEVCKACNI
ncbi:MAG: MBL fold metallo-hydrolase [Bacteroidia bacterium]|nr:MBL fold metallo-hydrolase [Bacteroidia bacterium]